MNEIPDSQRLDDELTAFIGDLDISEFKPCAYYDESLDCIRVLFKDCSAYETRLNKYITLIEDNTQLVNTSRVIGFTIKGVAHLFKSFEVPFSEIHNVVELLDDIAKRAPII